MEDAQTVRCLDIAERALGEVGAGIGDVVRTRLMLTDVTRWREAARAQGERFAMPKRRILSFLILFPLTRCPAGALAGVRTLARRA